MVSKNSEKSETGKRKTKKKMFDFVNIGVTWVKFISGDSPILAHVKYVICPNL